MKRKKLSKHNSKRLFEKTAEKTRKVNKEPITLRGGIRL